jgi:phosphoserine aminotransferase
MARAYNFNAGPAAIPVEVLQRAQEELVDYRGIGMSVMEISHRSKQFEHINDEAQSLLRELLNIPSGYKILFLQGGASTQFAMIPMNLLSAGMTAAFVHTGSWAEKAYKEAKLFGNAIIAASSEADQFTTVPALSSIQIPDNAAYLHITSNETIGGIQYKEFPLTGNVPLIADMSSDIVSRPIDVSKFALIYAGAQKNLGPSGVTVVIAREDLLLDSPKSLPTMLRYNTHVDNNSLYNTPPAYSVYMLKLVLEWIKEKGGLHKIEQLNNEKANLIYNAIDQSNGFYQGVAARDYRSLMNITFRMSDENLEKQFIKESEALGFVGLKGHRSVGGLRASTYNAVPYESCAALQQFMVDFKRRNS